MKLETSNDLIVHLLGVRLVDREHTELTVIVKDGRVVQIFKKQGFKEKGEVRRK